jgi:hypothetical protein
MARNTFTNPATGTSYEWPINHESEDAMGKVRNITRTSPTGNVGLVKQQGDDGPLLIKLHGTILSRAHYAAFWNWYALSRAQTIHFTDFDGQSYEVQITSFQPVRVRNLYRAGKDPHMHHWTYDMEMEVYTLLAGDLATQGVTP